MRPMLCLAVAALVGCAAADPAPAQSRRPEAVYAVVAAKDGLRFRVSSNGCTKKEDFEAFVATSIVPGPMSVGIDRRTPDTCKSFAIGSAWIEFTYEELRLTPASAFVVVNPLTPWRGPGD